LLALFFLFETFFYTGEAIVSKQNLAVKSKHVQPILSHLGSANDLLRPRSAAS
jgi:hypothetical protein